MRTNKFSKVVEHKINVENSVAFLYTNNESSEREIKKTIPFAVSSKKNKIPGNKFNQVGKRLGLGKL